MRAKLIAAWWQAEEVVAIAAGWLTARDVLLPAVLAVAVLAFVAGALIL